MRSCRLALALVTLVVTGASARAQVSAAAAHQHGHHHPPAAAGPAAPSKQGLRGPPKPSAPVALHLEVLEGGQPGTEAHLRLTATPWAVQARMDLDLALPEGLRVVEGATATTSTFADGRRVLEVVVEVPATGRFSVLGSARVEPPSGARWFRAVTLELPLGLPGKPSPRVPVREHPRGGLVAEMRGSGS